MSRINFLLNVTRKLVGGQDSDCPYCHASDTRLVGRKKIVLQLRECRACGLLFRYPKDDDADNKAFYQTAYRDPTATDFPAISDLPRHIETNFRAIARDMSPQIAAIRQYKPSGTLLDYGCSWGYGVYQFRAAGYGAEGYEISAPRAKFGRDHLGVTIHGSTDQLPDRSFDIIFSSHVLEHIPDPKIPFRDFRRLLKPDGLLMIFMPNGGGKLARELGTAWAPLIGEKHVVALTAEFFERNLSGDGLRLTFNSSPYGSTPRELGMIPNLDGDELMIIGRPA